MKYQLGVSIIVCCYNSIGRIEHTLAYLAKQKFRTRINVELIVVNNASTDETKKIVTQLLKTLFPLWSCSVIDEMNQGLTYARNAGIKNALYEYLLFCDDDNLLFPDYVQNAYDILSQNEWIGACGGRGIPEFLGVEEPEWFKKAAPSYALGSQLSQSGKLVRNSLYGAGLCIKHSIINELYQKKFHSFLTGRKGKGLLAGEDSELTKAILLLGYKLEANDSLLYKHIMPSNRLNKEYFYKMLYGFGLAYPVICLYECAIRFPYFNLYVFYYLYFLGLVFNYIGTFVFRKRDKKAIYRGAITAFMNMPFKDVHEVCAVIKRLSKS